ncbi:uncharacterized protein LMH87_007553 [Akanthomyces muscarius]|uniref:Uncharacterized protein n=1 Tax=Akanthomyces muscarius TaxID=2231603 RepID=A0A9W8UR71_AKAMU|nr:uncharacterized protein LMH87_007553 [Akanthomyces muscarius]KAJ4161516.1 hypothetical protein LMH87_007553 [Akanthomyces muscarius]
MPRYCPAWHGDGSKCGSQKQNIYRDERCNQGNYDGMDQYAKDIYHRISRILTLSERCTLLRICGQPPNPKYFFDAGGLIPIAGKGYSASDGHQNVELVLGAKGHISKEIAVQVQDGCTFYLLWIVKKE